MYMDVLFAIALIGIIAASGCIVFDFVRGVRNSFAARRRESVRQPAQRRKGKGISSTVAKSWAPDDFDASDS